MARSQASKNSQPAPMAGSQFEAKKNQGYQIPLYLWQQLHEEAGRRKRLGLPLGSQNAIACAALAEWLQSNRGSQK